MNSPSWTRPFTLSAMRKRTYLNGLGQFDITGGAMSLMSKLIGGASSGMPAANISSNVQTTVSPQISPVFVQQSNPSNSPVSTGVTQSSPSPQSAVTNPPPAQPVATPYAPGYIPTTGAMPGFDAASGFLPTGTPGLPSLPMPTTQTGSGTFLAMAGIVGLAFVIRSRRKKKGKGKGKA